MTILSVVKDVCARVGLEIPATSAFANIAGNRTMQEMLTLANEMAQRIATDTRDWTALRKTQTFTGDGVTTVFPLPADFRRLLKTSQVWLSSYGQAPAQFVSDPDQWLRRRINNETNVRSEWMLQGSSMHIWPAMGAGVTAQFAYLDRNCVNLAAGGVGEIFQADNDTFRLDERLLRLGLIYQWKADKGSPYAEDLGTYQDAIMNATGADKPAPTFVDHASASLNAGIAYPYATPTGPIPYWPYP